MREFLTRELVLRLPSPLTTTIIFLATTALWIGVIVAALLEDQAPRWGVVLAVGVITLLWSGAAAVMVFSCCGTDTMELIYINSNNHSDWTEEDEAFIQDYYGDVDV